MLKRCFWLLLVLCGSSNAALVSVDFSGFNAGDIVTDQIPGVSISLLTSPLIAGPRIYILQDTSNNPQDVLGATGNAITPGDNVGSINPPFFDIQFSFSTAVDYFSIQILDAEESLTGLAFLGGNLVESIQQGTFLGVYSAPVFNGPVYRMTLGSIGGSVHFDRVVIDLTENDGPELYDNVTFNTAAVPEPSAFSSLILAAGVALFLARKLRV